MHHFWRVIQEKNISKPFKSTATQKGSTRGGFADVYSLLQNIVDVKNGTLSRDDLKEKLHADEGQFSLPEPDSVNDYINSHGTEFVEVPPVRDYEIAKQRVKNQTYGELLAQIEKLSRDKRLTHGRVLDKGSVKESMNSMVRTLMAYVERCTIFGGSFKQHP